MTLMGRSSRVEISKDIIVVQMKYGRDGFEAGERL